MNDYTTFILAAYAAAFVGLGGLLVASLAARAKVRREIAARGLERTKR